MRIHASKVVKALLFMPIVSALICALFSIYDIEGVNDYSLYSTTMNLILGFASGYVLEAIFLLTVVLMFLIRRI